MAPTTRGLKMASFSCYTIIQKVKKITVVSILECGEVLSYTIPSFSVVTVKMRKVKYQCNVYDHGTGTNIVKVVDGFMKDDPSLDCLYPTEVAIKSNCRCACLI